MGTGGWAIMSLARWRPMHRLCLAVACITAASSVGMPSTAAEPAAGHVRLAVFDVDATPPIGAAMAYGPVVRQADLTLRARGTVLLGAGQPIVLCAVDWIGIGNAAHDEFRAALARAADTTPARVAVHALHQHDAPHADFTAERLLKEMGVVTHPRFTGEFHRDVIARTAAAVAVAAPKARPVTHVGFGRGRVEQVASNRRLLDDQGKLVAWRASAAKDPKIAGWPEGTIDPDVAALAFFSGDEPLAVLTSYATHPMSYYRTGVPGPDFPGIARLIRTQDVPAAMHVHFTGAAGNVAAGKYNDGSHGNRVTLALRLAAGMRHAYAAAFTNRQPLAADAVGWESVPVILPARADLDRAALAAQVRAKADRGTFSAIDPLAYMSRGDEQRSIDITCLRVGKTRMLHLPGELFVEYQLSAREMRPDLDVFLAAYGNYGTGYIGTAVAYAQGGYETQVTSSFVGPDAEPLLMAAMRKLLEAP